MAGVIELFMLANYFASYTAISETISKIKKLIIKNTAIITKSNSKFDGSFLDKYL